jgi:hypothetical protein
MAEGIFESWPVGLGAGDGVFEDQFAAGFLEGV